MAKNIIITPNLTGTDNPNIAITNGNEEIVIGLNAGGSLIFQDGGGTTLLELDSNGKEPKP
jgi:hypothetical protein